MGQVSTSYLIYSCSFRDTNFWDKFLQATFYTPEFQRYQLMGQVSTSYLYTQGVAEISTYGTNFLKLPFTLKELQPLGEVSKSCLVTSRSCRKINFRDKFHSLLPPHHISYSIVFHSLLYATSYISYTIVFCSLLYAPINHISYTIVFRSLLYAPSHITYITVFHSQLYASKLYFIHCRFHTTVCLPSHTSYTIIFHSLLYAPTPSTIFHTP